jgi:hypothetical protein
VRFRETSYVRQVAHAKWLPAMRRDPQAFGSVLQHNRRPRLVVGDGSVNPDPGSQFAYMVDRENAVHRCHGERPRTVPGRVEHVNVAQRRYIKHHTGLLHLVVEFSSGDAIHFYLGVQQTRDSIQILIVEIYLEVASIRHSLAGVRCAAAFRWGYHQVRGADFGRWRLTRSESSLGADQLVEGCRHGHRQAAVAQQASPHCRPPAGESSGA